MSVALLVPKCTAIILSLSNPKMLLKNMVMVTSMVAPLMFTGLKNFSDMFVFYMIFDICSRCILVSDLILWYNWVLNIFILCCNL